MRTCPGCGYLVPPAWEECKRCGASLAGAPVRSLVGAPAPTPDTDVETVPVAPSPPPPPSAPPPLAPAWGSTSAPAAPFATSAPAPWPPVVDPARTWSPAPTPAPPARTPRVAGVAAVALGVLAAVAGATFGFRAVGGLAGGSPTAHEFVLPYVAPSGAYRAMLPCAPTVTEQVIPLGNGASTNARAAMCDYDDHAVIVADALYPTGTVLPPDDLALRGAADGAAFNTHGTVARFEQADHDGLAAANVEIEAQGTHVRMHIVLGGSSIGQTSIVMAMVGSNDGARDEDFERLVESLSVTP